MAKPPPSLIQQIQAVPFNAYWNIFKSADSAELTQEVFDFLVQMLEDTDDRKRFFALYALIEKFNQKLSKPSDKLIENFFPLLMDESGPVLDRTIWAFSIMGKKGVEKLLENVHSPNLKLRERILWALARNTQLHLLRKEVLEALTQNLQSPHDQIRYVAMTALMENLNNGKIEGDFKEIYKEIKSVAHAFMNTDEKHISDFAARFYRRIDGMGI